MTGRAEQAQESSPKAQLLTQRLLNAKTDPAQIELLLADYLPFIKKQVGNCSGLRLEYEDMLSLAMLTFVNSIKQFRPEKGNFFSFAAVSIKNRLLDEHRKSQNYPHKIIPLHPQEQKEGWLQAAEEAASVLAYSKEQERLCLAEEIIAFSKQLLGFGIRFGDLVKISPKQKPARQRCIALARTVAADPSLGQELLVQQRLAQAVLAQRFQVHPKTIEKHRKYIVAVALLLLGDYPAICTFLPKEEVN